MESIEDLQHEMECLYGEIENAMESGLPIDNGKKSDFIDRGGKIKSQSDGFVLPAGSLETRAQVIHCRVMINWLWDGCRTKLTN